MSKHIVQVESNVEGKDAFVVHDLHPEVLGFTVRTLCVYNKLQIFAPVHLHYYRRLFFSGSTTLTRLCKSD